MLVLQRLPSEKVAITTPEGRRIWVTFIRQNGYAIKLGFEADEDVAIHREETQRRIDEERRHERP